MRREREYRAKAEAGTRSQGGRAEARGGKREPGRVDRIRNSSCWMKASERSGGGESSSRASGEVEEREAFEEEYGLWAQAEKSRRSMPRAATRRRR